jgi:hypothetical protein
VCAQLEAQTCSGYPHAAHASNPKSKLQVEEPTLSGLHSALLGSTSHPHVAKSIPQLFVQRTQIVLLHKVGIGELHFVKKGIRLLRAFTREVDRLARYRVVFYAQKTYEKNIRPANTGKLVNLQELVARRNNAVGEQVDLKIGNIFVRAEKQRVNRLNHAAAMQFQ